MFVQNINQVVKMILQLFLILKRQKAQPGGDDDKASVPKESQSDPQSDLDPSPCHDRKLSSQIGFYLTSNFSDHLMRMSKR